MILGEQEQAESYDARFLISTLLVSVAKGDGGISNLESDKMIDLLCARFDTRGPEALERLSSAIMALANDADITQKLQSISRGLSTDEKLEVLAMMLEVMVIDDVLDPGEIEAINLAGQILGLSQDDIHTAIRSISTDG